MQWHLQRKTTQSVKAKSLINNTAQLAWSTASESNNKQFIISRSDDGITFIRIATKAGAGNSSAKHHYTFQDYDPANGTNYYRLEQQDFDGLITDHGIKAVNFSFGAPDLIIYPNPTANTAYAKFEPGIYHTAELMNVNGAIINKNTIGKTDHTTNFDLLDLPSAVYLIRLIGKGGNSVKQVVKK